MFHFQDNEIMYESVKVKTCLTVSSNAILILSGQFDNQPAVYIRGNGEDICGKYCVL